MNARDFIDDARRFDKRVEGARFLVTRLRPLAEAAVETARDEDDATWPKVCLTVLAALDALTAPPRA
jgi:hypothetical protein